MRDTRSVEAEPIVAQATVCGGGDRCCDKSEESGEAIAKTGDGKTKHEAEASLGKLTGSGRNWRWSNWNTRSLFWRGYKTDIMLAQAAKRLTRIGS